MRLRAASLAPHPVTVDGKPVMLDEKTTAYAVRIDDRPPVTLEVSADRERYELATGLDPGRPHDVTITREAEAFAGVHELLGLDLAPGGTFLPVAARPLRIEILGDSIACGYGILGDKPCPFTYATERATAAYGARLGRILGADVTTLCWSGRGVLRNYDGSTRATMPELFELTIPTGDAVGWSFAKAPAPAPNAVILSLGTNDFLGGEGKPLDRLAFEDAYVKLARRVREVYPATLLLVTTSPMLKHEPVPSGPGFVDEVARTHLDHVVARRTAEGDRRIELIALPNDAPHWGCDGHPDAELNARIADRIAPVIRSRLAAP